ncbi:MAG: CpsB/CapC family capsule biosynthesis tyrosine phosphatase, partial [Thermonemataceae bacterium]|nr:CpsB/CapC family capsule biosynthesis tyrosine phosphatase [Thermonemataceae bacterium]
EAAAEYYLDEAFLDNLQKKSEILCFGKPKYVLFETGFLSMPPFIDEAIFLMQAEGYTPILAHPERYIYLYDNINYLEKMREMGVLLQVNLLSLAGYYSKESKKMAEKLIDAQLLSFLSSDCHHQKHIDAIEHLYSHYNFSKIQKLKLLNNSLLD